MDKDERIKQKYEGTAYSAKYDGYFKIETGEWVEPACIDPDCEYCDGRPNNYYDLFDEDDIPAMRESLRKNNQFVL